MQQILSTPVQTHARRAMARGQDHPSGADLRWQLLDLVRTCRHRLTLRDRDLAVLRGLLSLLPGSTAQRVVFASNRVLIDRCDGIDERTLRRRLAHLQDKGLVHRRHSPNGKRYQVRDEDNATQLAYGIDLTPLFQLQPHLEALAEDCAREGQRIALLKARLRDALFHAGGDIPADLAEDCRLALRRVLTSAQLETLLRRLHDAAEPRADAQPAQALAQVLSVSDGQNDRHIQRSDKESLNKKGHETQTSDPADEDLTVAECMELAPASRSMAIDPPQSWRDIIALSGLLGPAIGLKRPLLQDAEAQLGPHGCALAVIGLVEAFGRIRNPEAYLRTLIRTARDGGLNLCRMFRSLVRPGPMAMARG